MSIVCGAEEELSIDESEKPGPITKKKVILRSV